MPATSNTKKVGGNAEARACEHLQAQGLRLLERNYFCALGEIDLIMQEGEDIVFVEVRSRSNTQFSNSIESIDIYKQRKIIKTAVYYMQKKNCYNKVNCRFDVIGIDNTQLEWIKNAFDAEIY